jgi:uncharacterized delta-60 repeat protein
VSVPGVGGIEASKRDFRGGVHLSGMRSLGATIPSMTRLSRCKVFFIGATLSVGLAVLVFACGDDGGSPSQCQGASCDGGTESSTPDGPPADTNVTDGGGDADSSLPIVCNEGGAGTLDPTFGDGGLVWLKFTTSDEAHAVAVQADGKILVGGSTNGSNPNFALVRLLPDGTPDPSFGAGGLVVRTIGDRNATIEALAVLADGRIVAAGETTFTGQPFAFVALRYLPDGGPDTTFGDGGAVITNFPSKSAYAYSLALQTDGRLIVGGEAENAVNSTGTGDYALVRYNTDGTLDTAFGAGGLVLVDIHGTRDAPGAVALTSSGKIVIAGASSSTGDDPVHVDATAARLDSTGVLDPSFGDAGRFSTSYGSAQGAGAVLVDSSERILLGGQYDGSFGLFRLSPTGTLDPTFGDAGVAQTRPSPGTGGIASLIIQGDGRLIGLGLATAGSKTGSIAAARYLQTGRLDESFGASGQVSTPPPPNADLGATSAVIHGCSFVTTGTWFYNETALTQTAMGIARYRR